MYTDSQRAMMIGVPGTPISFASTGIKGASTCLPIMRPVNVQALAITITTAITVTDAIMTLKYRPTPGSASGEVALGTMTLPVTGSAIGKQYYKKLASYKALPGGEIVLDVTQAGTAGAGIGGVLTDEVTEPPGNVPNMVASA